MVSLLRTFSIDSRAGISSGSEDEMLSSARSCLVRSRSETRDRHCINHSYENVYFSQNTRPGTHIEKCIEEIHIPRITPHKKKLNFKVGEKVNNYSLGTSAVGSRKIIADKESHGPSSLGSEKNPTQKSACRLNSRSVANISNSSGTKLKSWQVSVYLYFFFKFIHLNIRRTNKFPPFDKS